MGLKIHSIANLPIGYRRDYYLYLLDYGWEELIQHTLYENFDKMAAMASKNDAVILSGTIGSEFNDEVLSWHKINGEDADKLLPAILITNQHPKFFKVWEHNYDEKTYRKWKDESLLLIPLKNFCDNASDVIEVINKIFLDIKQKKELSEFKIAREMKAGKRGALLNALILEPNFGGLGIDLKNLINYFKK